MRAMRYAYLLTAGAALTAALPAMATIQRTFVASTGSDAGPCSAVAPCRSFGAAIAQTNSGGDVVVLDSAGYGPVAITKSVSIRAPMGIYAAITVSSGDGVAVNAPGADVSLHGLSIVGQGGATGIRSTAVSHLRIENCAIAHMTGNGIHLAAAQARTFVTDSLVRGNAYGVVVLAAGRVVLDRVRAQENTANGLAVSPLIGSVPVSVVATDSHFSENGQDGVAVGLSASTTASIQIERSVIADNGGGGIIATAGSPGSRVIAMLTRNVVSNNQNDGIRIVGSAPGSAKALVTQNAVSANGNLGIVISGNSATMEVSANTVHSEFVPDLACDANATLRTRGDNVASAIGQFSGPCTLATVGGL